jgi:flagellar hook-basal body complex protein FliE
MKIQGLSEVAPVPVAEPAAKGASFAGELGKAIASLDEQQVTADQEAAKLAMGGGNLHETALALEKADIAMRLATKVRNKLVEAYQDVMRMSI